MVDDGTSADGNRFKTGLVYSEQPPLGTTQDGEQELEAYWKLYGGKPDVVGATLEEVIRGILDQQK